MRRPRSAPFAALCVALSGCVASYVAPQGAGTAKLTIRTEDSTSTNIWFYRYRGGFDEYRCSKNPGEGITILRNVSLVTSYADQGKNVKSVDTTVVAGEPFRLATQVPTYELRGDKLLLTWCMPQIRFLPVAGKHYVAVHGGDGSSCSMSLFELDETTQATRQTEYERLPACYDSKNGNRIWEDKVKAEYAKKPDSYR